jgi:hypothetical protein
MSDDSSDEYEVDVIIDQEASMGRFTTACPDNLLQRGQAIVSRPIDVILANDRFNFVQPLNSPGRLWFALERKNAELTNNWKYSEIMKAKTNEYVTIQWKVGQSKGLNTTLLSITWNELSCDMRNKSS